MDCKSITDLYVKLEDKRSFDFYVQIMRNGLSKNVLQCYLEERKGYIAHTQQALDRVYKKMTTAEQKKFVWLKPFIVKRADALEPDITRMLNSKKLRTDLRAFLKFLISHFECPGS